MNVERTHAADVTWSNVTFTSQHTIIYRKPRISRLRRLLIRLRLARPPQDVIVAITRQPDDRPAA